VAHVQEPKKAQPEQAEKSTSPAVAAELRR
jgi:hypothetical protein